MRFWKFNRDDLERNQLLMDQENNQPNNQSNIELQSKEKQSSKPQENSSEGEEQEPSEEKGESSSDTEDNQLNNPDEEESQEGKGQSNEPQENSSEGEEQEPSEEKGESPSDSEDNQLNNPDEEESQEGKGQSNEPQENSSEGEEQEPSEEKGESSSDTEDNQSNEDKIEELAEEIENNSKLTNEEKLQLLEKLKKSIEEIKKRKALKLQRKYLHPEKQEVTESQEEEYPLSAQQNNFLNQLQELPSFKDRERGPGYSIDTESITEIPESLIRTLITKFLNQRFCLRNTDLNVRSNSLEKSDGFYKWDVKDVIVDFKTHQLNKVLHDKYGYDYADGKNENVPLSFYFDMSGSMSRYTNMLAVIAIELLKKDVKVLIGYNERVNVQIESIEKNITVQELAKILEYAGYDNMESFKKNSKVKYKLIAQNIDNYLISKKAEKCVLFSDFDPRKEVINLSQVANVYWFCFESSCDSTDFGKFNGFVYKVQGLEDIAHGLVKVSEKRFETLCYVDNPKSLQKERAK